MKMKRLLAMAAMILFFLGGVRLAFAHRLDEYLQAILLTLRQDHVEARMRLIPGVSVASSVIANIDTNRDGILSAAEQQSYARRVLDNLTLIADGCSIAPRLVSATFPQIEQMRGGLGEIHIEFIAPLPQGSSHRSLILENPQNPSSVYLVNVTVPEDSHIHVLAQKRNEQQSTYELDYEQISEQIGVPTDTSLRSRLLVQLNSASLLTLFSLGTHHIAEGTDHLLFLLALLLPAPLIASRSRWVSSPTIRPGLIRVLKIVTVFTLGHSLTLVLAALGFVHVAGRPVEVLIAVSILVSAFHALRPIFPGKEAAIAAFFGLIHGLAFASTLNHLGLGWGESLIGILAFNLGIESMQLLVIAAALPSLMLMSRTAAYSYLRVPAALFAVFASLGWITERLFNVNTPIDALINAAARHAAVIAGMLFLISLGCRRMSSEPYQGSHNSG